MLITDQKTRVSILINRKWHVDHHNFTAILKLRDFNISCVQIHRASAGQVSNSFADFYNNTVLKEKGADVAKLSGGDIFQQCWEILAVGKIANGVGMLVLPRWVAEKKFKEIGGRACCRP